MKTLAVVLIVATFGFGFLSVRRNSGLKERVASLEEQIGDTYHPGMADFMNMLQARHAKLWFAGHHRNWELAAFQCHETRELIEDIRKYKHEKAEAKMLCIIEPALDTIDLAILRKDHQAFNSGFASLTLGCNSCHEATNHAFNVITIPESLNFSNQRFDTLPAQK